jgi:beta-lactamase class A
MTAPRSVLPRRALLSAALLLPLAGCAPPSSHAVDPPPSPAPTGALDAHLTALEQRFDARLGVYALATGTGATVAHRADERFAFCSTFKALATAAVLHRNPLTHLDVVVRYTGADLMKSSLVTREHLATGMTIGALCDAAVRYSDGTAGNLLLRDLGGPAELTAYARSIGDTVTRMDRVEPDIVSAIPGDPRDTSSPRALGADLHALVLGDALEPAKREHLRDLLVRNTTGANRIRAALPAGWTAANKTGTGDHGTLNDLAVVWPPDSAPLVVAIMSSKAAPDAPYDEALLAEAAAHVLTTLA